MEQSTPNDDHSFFLIQQTDSTSSCGGDVPPASTGTCSTSGVEEHSPFIVRCREGKSLKVTRHSGTDDASLRSAAGSSGALPSDDVRCAYFRLPASRSGGDGDESIGRGSGGGSAVCNRPFPVLPVRSDFWQEDQSQEGFTDERGGKTTSVRHAVLLSTLETNKEEEEGSHGNMPPTFHSYSAGGRPLPSTKEECKELMASIPDEDGQKAFLAPHIYKAVCSEAETVGDGPKLFPELLRRKDISDLVSYLYEDDDDLFAIPLMFALDMIRTNLRQQEGS